MVWLREWEIVIREPAEPDNTTDPPESPGWPTPEIEGVTMAEVSAKEAFFPEKPTQQADTPVPPSLEKQP